MQKKSKTRYKCANCGAISPKWVGQCSECKEWNTYIEFIDSPSKINKYDNASANFHYLNTTNDPKRYLTKISEFDRVVGGGIMSGSIVLLGGDPGIGKSTIALQILNYLIKNENIKALYFSGEESVHQLSLRAKRLNINDKAFLLSTEVNIAAILNGIKKEKPQIAIIDSIQTTYSPNSGSLPGSISQVRECATELMTVGKKNNIIIILIGHITKDGNIAGPKLLEHLVDTVLYMEGDKNNYFRILRSVKNRFGSTNEIGIFEMKQQGLEPVQNPSEIFLNERRKSASGSVVTCGLDSSRPLLIEIQALTAKATYAAPQRTTTGINTKRLSMLLAVIERQLDIFTGQFDVFVNIVGGLKFNEPAMDLPTIIAIVSSVRSIPIPDDTIIFGEVGLTGEIRNVSRIEQRVTESLRMGFKQIFLPESAKKSLKHFNKKIKLNFVPDIQSLVKKLF